MKKMTLAQVRKAVLILSFVVLVFGTGYLFGQQKVGVPYITPKPEVKIERNLPGEHQDVDFQLFWEVWDRLEGSFLDKDLIDPAKMVYGAISGMVSSLGDPYTVFLPPQAQKQSKEDLSGAFGGVGIQLGYKNSHLAVIAPLSDTPAEAAGVKAGDLIVHIKDEKKGLDKNTTGMSLPEAVTDIRGEIGTKISLTLAREGVNEPFEVEIIRGEIVVKSVEVSFIGNVAHLRLLRFGERTYQEWGQAVSKVLEEKTKNPQFAGVVLDLRNNPGGFLQGAVYMASEFLKDGVVVKQEQSQDGGVETFSVNRQGQLTGVPLVVLVNSGSASASEIVAGALQEKGRAEVVGEKTFGKGTIQEAEEFTGGAGLHITVARWLLPSGKAIDKEGITPDHEVKMDPEDQTKDPQLEKAIQILKSGV